MLEMWTIYDRPRDYPDQFVARLWIGETATDEVMLADDLDSLRLVLERMGLVCLTRQAEDDLAIVEVWL